MNSAFYSSDKEQQAFLKQLQVLIDYNKQSTDYYFDIHIYQEEDSIRLDWEQVPYSHEWGGHFEFLEDDDVVLKEVIFPDNHTEYLFEDEKEEALNDWCKEHPEYKKTSYGTWTNVEDNRWYFVRYNLDPNDTTNHSYTTVYNSSQTPGEVFDFALAVNQEDESIDLFNTTDFIVVGKDVADMARDSKNVTVSVSDYVSDANVRTHKLGILNWTKDRPSQEDEIRVKAVPIYYSPVLTDNIHFYNDNNRLLANVHLVEQ